MIVTRVLQTRQETPDTVTLRLSASPDIARAVVPGQFVMLGTPLPVDGVTREVRRSYSVAGVSPAMHDTSDATGNDASWVEVTIKRQQPGLFSVYVQDLAPGDTLGLYGPFGRQFVWNPLAHEAAVPLVLIAGGSGIAPFRLFLDAALRAHVSAPIVLFASCKTHTDRIYAKEFDEWKARGIHIVETLTRPSADDVEFWTGRTGRLNAPAIRAGLVQAGILDEEISRAAFFVCGPTALVVDVQAALAALGVPVARIKTEKYGAIDG